MSLSKKQYRNFLKSYKQKEYKDAPGTTEAYADFWEAAMLQDLKESLPTGGFTMHFKKFQKDGPLLVMNKEGKLPEKYEKKFAAYPTYGLDIGLDVVVTSKDDGNEGRIYRISVSKREG